MGEVCLKSYGFQGLGGREPPTKANIILRLFKTSKRTYTKGAREVFFLSLPWCLGVVDPGAVRLS